MFEVIVLLSCVGLFAFSWWFKRSEISDLKGKILLLEADKKFYIDRAENAEKFEKKTLALLREEYIKLMNGVH
jgi:hypothetical protein